MNEHTPEKDTPENDISKYYEPEYDELGFIKSRINLPDDINAWLNEPDFFESAFLEPEHKEPEHKEPEQNESKQNEPELDIPEQNEQEEKEGKTERVRMELYDWLQCVVTAIICGVLIFVLVGRTIGVDGRSMLQTLRHNDRVVISNLFYTPANGDIVVFQSPSEQFAFPLVKRVIAVAGQTVSIDFDTGSVYIDGNQIDEPYISSSTVNKHDFTEPVTVPVGFIFVMGDNRGSSTDSRDNVVGLVDTRYILGKVLFILIPGSDDNGNRDWSRFGVTA